MQAPQVSNFENVSFGTLPGLFPSHLAIFTKFFSLFNKYLLFFDKYRYIFAPSLKQLNIVYENKDRKNPGDYAYRSLGRILWPGH